MPLTSTRPAVAPLATQLAAAIDNWSSDQRSVVELAAAFADSVEWAAAGAPTPAHWIAQAADIEVSTAREWIRVGRRIRELPRLARAFELGQLSYTKVRVLTRIATVSTEADLLTIGRSVSAGQLPRAIAAWLGRTSDAATLERHQHEQRSVSWRAEPDGMVGFTLRLPPLVAGVLIARLSMTVMTSVRRVDGSADWPTLAQQYADAFEMTLREGGGSVVTEIVLHVRGDGCTLDDGSPIPASVIEKVAPEALIRALIHDAAGQPINASHRRRHPTARQKRVVKERDRTCIDCGSPNLLEYDHNPEYRVSRHTVVDELELRCAVCHQRRHATV